jgi:hypothetical protein
MKIAFPTGTLTYRGTHIALYDYAYFNQKILGNESLIYLDEKNPGPKDLVEKFKKEFHCIKSDGWSDISLKIQLEKCDAAYIIKSGEKDNQSVKDTPNLIHAVFPQSIKERHGNVYAFVSDWLSEECSNNQVACVPHMINIPKSGENLRNELNIPQDATVFGCHGGQDSFDINFVHKTIFEVCGKNKNIWFVFMNIKPFSSHERLIFLNATTDVIRKVNFISTCDAMIHARGIGESFGLACGEFSVKNKPVITYGLSPQRAHLKMLGNKAIIYRGPKELKNCLEDFDRSWSAKQNWDQYTKLYNPDSVMKRFSNVFLNNELTINGNDKFRFGLNDWFAVESAHIQRRLRSHSRKYYHMKH